MAASRTAPGRTPHSVHVYYVRAGDAREPVDILVDVARDCGTLSTRQITARQDGPRWRSFGGRGLTTSTMYNRAGQLVCIATQELYFGRGARATRRHDG